MQIKAKLRKIIWIRYTTLFLFIGFITIGVLIFRDLSNLLIPKLILFNLWLLLLAGLQLYLKFVRCPRCNEYFFMNVHKKNLSGGLYNPFRDNCINCGIMIGKWKKKS